MVPAPSVLRTMAQRLREARLKAGLSQEEVALRIGSTPRSLTRWENGECDPGFVSVRAMARLYSVSLDWIAGDAPPRSRGTARGPGT
ncbi:MAG: helix-turn-helix transcriptional regulator [Planctomycetota bacterium]